MFASDQLPIELIDAFREGRAAVFIGAGASIDAGFPTWDKLVADLASRLDPKIEPDAGSGKFSTYLLNAIPQYYEDSNNRGRLLERLKSLMYNGSKKTSKVHELLVDLPCRRFYTTNYDELLEQALDHVHLTYAAASNDDQEYALSEAQCQVHKIHGTIGEHGQRGPIVITRTDYARFIMDRTKTVENLRHALGQYVFLFVGYSLRDPDFNSIYDSVFYRKPDENPRHFICMASPTKHEVTDLGKRGINVIDLDKWLGDTPTARLTSFLTALAEATSEVVYIQRFFQGIGRDQHIHIVTDSSLNDAEQYVLYPVCDIHAARQIERVLSLIGCTSEIVSDQSAMRKDKIKHYTHNDLILVCSPFGNKLTRRFFTLGQRKGIVRQNFDEKNSHRVIEYSDGKEKHTLVADNPIKKTKAIRKEYALIGRYRNPWNRDKHIFVFAGLHALGTHAIGDFLKDPTNFRELALPGENLCIALEIRYEDHDPYDYKYDLSPRIILWQES